MRKNVTQMVVWAGMLATLAIAGAYSVSADLASRSAAVRDSRERGDSNSSSNMGWLLLVLTILGLATAGLVAWFTGKLGDATSQ